MRCCDIKKLVNQFLLDWGATIATGLNTCFVCRVPKATNAGLFDLGGRQRCHKAPPNAVSKLVLAASDRHRVFSPTGLKFMLYAQQPLSAGLAGSCWHGRMADRNAAAGGGAGAAVAIIIATTIASRDALRQEVAVYMYLLPFAPGVRRQQFYGYFCGGKQRHAIVLEYAGEAISSYDALSVEEK
jgi:hypothetical protein